MDQPVGIRLEDFNRCGCPILMTNLELKSVVLHEFSQHYRAACRRTVYPGSPAYCLAFMGASAIFPTHMVQRKFGVLPCKSGIVNVMR